MKVQEYVDALEQELRAQGVSEWSIDWAHNHPRLSFAWKGGIITHTMPGSPSDRRGIERSVSDLRRRMGVKRVVLKSAAPPKRKKTVVSLADLPAAFTVKPDPMQALSVVKDRIEAAAAEAVTQARWLGLPFTAAFVMHRRMGTHRG